MAVLWTIITVIVLLKNVISLPGPVTSKSDLSFAEKDMKNMPEEMNICPSDCDCNRLNNLIINCGFRKLNVLPDNLDPSVFYLNFVGNNVLKLSYNASLKTLNTLNVSENNISEIDSYWTRSLIQLKYLDLSKNSLKSGAIERALPNVNLLLLDLSNNKLSTITDLMFYQMNALLILNLSFNEIELISFNSFSDLNKLETLDLSNNKLGDVQHEWLKNLQSLQILILKQNNVKLLRNVVFSTLKSLQVLDLSENFIKSIGLLSFKGLVKLKYLNISRNEISHFQNGVFRSLDSMKVVDLSQNPFASIDNIFIHTKNLEFLHLKELTRFKELTPSSLAGMHQLKYLNISGSKELSQINLKAFFHAKNLRTLDVSNTNLTDLKMGTFNNLHKIEILKLSDNSWKCDCYMYWLLVWLGEHTNTHLLSPSETFCNKPSSLENYVLLDALDHNMICTNSSIYNYTTKTKFKVGSPALLECNIEGNPLPSLTWITPQKEAFRWESFKSQTKQNTTLPFTSGSSPNPFGIYPTVEKERSRFHLLHNGNLAIQNVERGDGGFYVCIASNPLSHNSVSIRLTLDYEYFVHIKIVSILVGLATSFGFLLLTLISVLIKMILKRFGVRCPCHNGNASPRTQQIKKILESMEHYKKQQLDKLRDNYNVQVQKIKDNCMQQMERLRESYSSQAERLRDIKEYGTLQIDRIRENYYCQVQRVRDYSASQIVRLRGNYIFQRNRIRKFSAHHLYKLRENYKVQQQHLNKILENLNIESCRNVCHRTDSVVFDHDITLENVLMHKICLETLAKEISDSNDNSSQLSAYFTPDEEGSEISGHDSDACESLENIPKLEISPDVSLTLGNKAASSCDVSRECEDISFNHGIDASNQNSSHETIV